MHERELLVGRRAERMRISELLDGLEQRGAVLIVRGAAGVGKSALLTEAVMQTRSRGMAALATAGVQSEANLAFAGLHQLLQPLLARLQQLPLGQSSALKAAFGMADGGVEADPFLIALGTVELLATAAQRGAGLLVTVGDAQWIDGPTARVLAFVARRTASLRMAMLVEIRDGYTTDFSELNLPGLELQPLADGDARALLEQRHPEISTIWRDYVLALAEGNPLALVELPVAIAAGAVSESEVPGQVPLTARLERAFGARFDEADPTTRALLIVAAENDDDSLAEALAAAQLVDDTITADTVEPAVRAALVVVDRVHLHLRHPLVRSALRAAASRAERIRAHQALAYVLSESPDRQAWHRAAATTGRDESVASRLEDVARRAGLRGGAEAAVDALERAAQLTPDEQLRGRRYVSAAEVAIEAGDSARATRLLRAAELTGLSTTEDGRARLVREALDPGRPGDSDTVVSLTQLASEMSATGNEELAFRALQAAAAKSWLADPGEAARAGVVMVAESLPLQDDSRLLSILAFADPEGRGPTVVERAMRLDASRLGPEAAESVGVALNIIGEFDLSSAFIAAAVTGLRREGRLRLLPEALAHQTWTAINSADWPLAITAAEEGTRLARITGQPLWDAASTTGRAMIAGLRGDLGAADALAAEAEAIALPTGASAVLAGVQLSRGATALAAGKYELAYDHLRRTFDPSDPSYHHFQRAWNIGDLAEAAARCGHRDEARRMFDDLEPLARSSRSSWLVVGLTLARPLVAKDRDAESAFLAGLQTDLSGWPLYRGRLLLEYGSWLRRQRRIVQSRVPLREARDWFDRCGLVAWSARAREELRAAGEESTRARREAWSSLSPQELQVALMASEGLTNEEIAGRLFLSRRTVGSHLYRAFPKLGISSRGQLRRALEARDGAARLDQSGNAVM